MFIEAAGHHWLTFMFRSEEFAIRIGNPEQLDTIQQEIASSGTFYEVDELLLIKQHLKPGARIVDAGANFGNHAIFFDRVCRGGEVIVFEPNPEAIEELRANLEKNGCAHVNTAHLGIALGERPDRADLFLSTQNEEWSNRAGLELRPNPDGAVPVARLDELIQRRVDLLKVDVEGMAMQVLRGAERIIAESRPILFVEIEDSNRDAFLALLEQAVYEPRAVTTMYRGIKNYLCVPRIRPAANALIPAKGGLVQRFSSLLGPLLTSRAAAPHSPMAAEPLTTAIEAHEEQRDALLGEALAEFPARLSEVRYAQTAQEELSMVDLLPAIQALYADRRREDPVSVVVAGSRWSAGAQLLARLHHRWSYASPVIEVTAVDPDPAHARVGQLLAPDVAYRIMDPLDLEPRCCDLLIASDWLQLMEQPIEALRRLRAAARDFVLASAPFEEKPLLEGHLSVIDRTLAVKADAAAIRIYENSAWKDRGRSIAMLFTSAPVPPRTMRRLKEAGFGILLTAADIGPGHKRRNPNGGRSSKANRPNR